MKDRYTAMQQAEYSSVLSSSPYRTSYGKQTWMETPQRGELLGQDQAGTAHSQYWTACVAGPAMPHPVIFSCHSLRMARSISPACTHSKHSLRLISGSSTFGDELLNLYILRNFTYDTHIVHIAHRTPYIVLF